MALLHHPTFLHHPDWSISVLSAYEYTVILPASLPSARRTKHTDVGRGSLRDYSKSKILLTFSQLHTNHFPAPHMPPYVNFTGPKSTFPAMTAAMSCTTSALHHKDIISNLSPMFASF